MYEEKAVCGQYHPQNPLRVKGVPPPEPTVGASSTTPRTHCVCRQYHPQNPLRAGGAGGGGGGGGGRHCLARLLKRGSGPIPQIR
jgi:hypothetical protein